MNVALCLSREMRSSDRGVRVVMAMMCLEELQAGLEQI